MILYRQNFQVKPLVSVVLCSYNRANYIVRAIDSILNQKTEFSYEILVGDDASTDESVEILQNYKNKYPEIFTLILHDKNNGAGSNWAQLMKIASGRYIALCDDDDYWHDTSKLQKQVEVLENDSSIGLVHTNFRYYYPLKKRFREIKIKNSNSKPIFQALFDGDYMIITSTVVFRRELLDKYVNLDDYIKLNFPTQDWVTWMQIAKYTNFFHLPASTTTYCLSDESVTRSRDFTVLTERYEKEKKMYKYVCDKFPDNVTFDNYRWEQHVNKIFLAFSYNMHDFRKAKFYGKKLHKTTLRVLFSQNKLFFKIFLYVKEIYNIK